MAETFVLAQGDTSKPLRAQLTAGDESLAPEDRPPISLATATQVDFYLNSSTANPEAAPLVSRQAVVEDAPNGHVRVDWQAADTEDLIPGVYLGQFRVTWATGHQTHPDEEPIEVIVTPFVG